MTTPIKELRQAVEDLRFMAGESGVSYTNADWLLGALDELEHLREDITMEREFHSAAVRILYDNRDALRLRLAAAVEALTDVGRFTEEGGEGCWCELPSMIPHRGHDGGCLAARAVIEKEKANE